MRERFRRGMGRRSSRAGALVRVLAFVVCGGCVGVASLNAQFYEVVHDFGGGNGDGATPEQPLALGSDGNLYGTTISGGSTDYGTLFRYVPKAQAFSILINFDQTEVTQGVTEFAGYLFGSRFGTVAGCGFAHFMTYRADFIGNSSDINCDLGSAHFSALTPAYGGLWGVDPFGGGVFEMDASGSVKIQTPVPFGETTLLLASDGNLYGVVRDANGEDIVRIDSLGNVTEMHHFTGADGEVVNTALAEQGGFLWGTAIFGGAYDNGTMYRMDFAGNFAVLHDFGAGSIDPAQPTGLIVASASSFYGTSGSGGQFGGGTLFQIDSFGNPTILHSFGDAGDGAGPEQLLPIGGSLWGTTAGGGVNGKGTLYVYSPSFNPAVLHLTPTAGPVRVLPGDPVQIHGGVFPVGEVPIVKIGGLTASNVVLLDQEDISAATPPDLVPGTLNEIIIVLPDGTQASLEDAWMADFLDVPQSDRLHGSIERVFRAGLMDGCGGGNFCESGTVDRATLVTMSLKAKHGPAWMPPACTGVFKDVACPGPQADWVEDSVAEGIAQPCGRDKFCPDRKLTRDEIPDILLKTEHGADYVPPACGGIFKDVKCPGPSADAIEQVYNEGLVEACATNPLKYCPNRKVERGPIAEYAAKAFRLP